jgi:hypothetical protein
MAVTDDLEQLAQQDVVYLTRSGFGPTVVYRGRLHQALSGDWVFNTSVGQNGVVGILLGGVDGSWSSNESPQAGQMVQILYPTPVGPTEILSLLSVIPVDLTD